MFLSKKILNKLMKEAYKGAGLRVCFKKGGWLFIAGEYWRTEIRKVSLPKETLGDLIKLIGEIPEEGEMMEYSKSGAQLELDYDNSVLPETKDISGRLRETNAMIIGEQGILQKVYQDPDTGYVFAINNIFSEMVAGGACMDYEIRPESASYTKTGEVYWINDTCRLRARIRRDLGNDKFLKALDGEKLLDE